MGTQTTYPNGQVLTSSALTPTGITNLLQTLTMGMIGLDPTVQANFAKVKIDWQTQGQPFQEVNFDGCYLQCVPVDVEYSRVRDLVLTSTVDGPQENWTYTKGWRVEWVFYGPTAEDNARAVRSGLFMDYFLNLLANSNLFPLPDAPEVMRVPEEINAQWWEVARYHIDMYEAVVETITDGAVSSLEIKVYDSSGEVADITVES